jgi:uncharacterized repeat protein (TIGR04138 family)
MPQRSNMTREGKPLTIEEVAHAVGVYPVEAYVFVQEGLRFTVARLHGAGRPGKGKGHVSGQQIARGLREYAQLQWGMMATTVLRSWSITTTYDFGRIVFALVEGGIIHKTDEDNIDEFRNVYDLRNLQGAYRIESKL